MGLSLVDGGVFLEAKLESREGVCEEGIVREALLFNRFCNFLLKAVLVLPVQSSSCSRTSHLCGMGTSSIIGASRTFSAISCSIGM
jgi:hypothetical protein